MEASMGSSDSKVFRKRARGGAAFVFACMVLFPGLVMSLMIINNDTEPIPFNSAIIIAGMLILYFLFYRVNHTYIVLDNESIRILYRMRNEKKRLVWPDIERAIIRTTSVKRQSTRIIHLDLRDGGMYRIIELDVRDFEGLWRVLVTALEQRGIEVTHQGR